jgi:hypothetical protein
VDRARLAKWIEDYERAWRTPGTEPLAELFAPDATYSMGPFEPTHQGLDAIAELWEREREGGPDEPFRMTSEIVAVEGDTGVARLDVRYDAPPRHYRDIWIVRLDQAGLCTHFEEWPLWPELGTHAPAGA